MKRKSQSTISSAKKEIAEKKANVSDKIIAHYDAYIPDTKFNKKRFSEFFLFQPTPDVKNVYCYADEMGIDHDYQFSFNCDSSTINRIISNLKLKREVANNNYSQSLWHNFSWWDSIKIEKLIPVSKKEPHESYSYLWYDTANRKAYYFSFDM